MLFCTIFRKIGLRKIRLPVSRPQQRRPGALGVEKYQVFFLRLEIRPQAIAETLFISEKHVRSSKHLTRMLVPTGD